MDIIQPEKGMKHLHLLHLGWNLETGCEVKEASNKSTIIVDSKPMKYLELANSCKQSRVEVTRGGKGRGMAVTV